MPHNTNDAPDNALLDTALQMVDVWNRLSPEKQALLLKRFGTQENALAALVTTQLLNPATPKP
ncbi:hypothetical protein HKK55_18365 [Pseudomonas sp. ADAK18]|uniref:hypothetical protein n=1 Tax=Pseudomonas sp. ADAK18 TaxID=2730848 RepID=UPI00146457F1|nr:hypothetical protein [Pseudomonas sp. ADAK18]QJI30584.1 hypothetical protein HKK55_18365 [Pseudomonas sp. ADAK18]